MFEAGHGSPVLLIPGIQGRWEWMRPTVDALAAHHRVATYSLAGDPEDVPPYTATSFDDFVRQAINVLNRAGMARAAVCGVSYGGLIAARLAARHPERVSALILSSPLPPDYAPNERIQRSVEHPILMAPTFLAGAVQRALPEIRRARPADWMRCALGLATTAVRRPQSPARMAARLRLLQGEDLSGDCRRISVPTLILTGEDDLDRVVPPELSRRYLQLIPEAELQCCTQTGHFGLVTRAGEFAQRVGRFLARAG
jgi:3-oxoadipate enol-lactonase